MIQLSQELLTVMSMPSDRFYGGFRVDSRTVKNARELECLLTTKDLIHTGKSASSKNLQNSRPEKDSFDIEYVWYLHIYVIMTKDHG